MRKDQTTFRALLFLLQAGQVRENDFNLFIYHHYSSRHSANRAILRMISDGYLERKTYYLKKQNRANDKDTIVRLTAKGKAYMIDALPDNYYKENYKKFSKRFPKMEEGAKESEKTEKLLTDTGILALFSSCGIPVFPHDKPSLLYLRDCLSGSFTDPKPNYKDTLTQEECEAYLKKGIYYTNLEFMSYVSSISADFEDTVMGTRIRGVFISDKNCFPVYTSKKYENRILRVNIKGEKGLINALRSLEQFTKIYRPIPLFDTFEFSPSNNKKIIKSRFRNEPYALIVSDGEMLAYATATGYAKGRMKTSFDPVRSTMALEQHYFQKPSGNGSSKASTYLTAASSLYKRIYVTPSNINGLYALDYLITHSLEDWWREGCNILSADDRFTKIEDSLDTFPYADSTGALQTSVYYMPVFEAKILFNLAHSSFPPTILTYADLLNMIAHSLRKDTRYYDAESRNFFDRNAVYIYDERGQIKGQRVLDDFLKEKGHTYSKNEEFFDLPRRLAKDSISLYNEIARGEIDLNSLASQMVTKDYVPEKRYYPTKKKIISVSLNKSIATDLQKIAVAGGVSVSQMLNTILKEKLNT